MIYGSVCSGIEGASVAWEPLGWRAAFFAEIEPFCCALLKHRFPDIPNRGDLNGFAKWPATALDVLVGGTPCQSFSVAGLRAGLADPRGNLALDFLAVADRFRPRWVVWENVPGVLSSNGGRDFGSFLGGLAKLGYGIAYRVLDAQFVRVDGFGRAVPQRRRRVFVIGYSGGWRGAAAVLFERSCLRWDNPPRRRSGQSFATDVAPSLVASGRGSKKAGESRGQDPVVGVAFGGNNTSGAIEVGTALSHHSGMGRLDFETETFVASTVLSHGEKGANPLDETLIPAAFNIYPSGGQGAQLEASPTEIANAVSAVQGEAQTDRGTRLVVPFDSTQITHPENRSNPNPGDPSHSMPRHGHPPAIAEAEPHGWRVRRLSVTECERLMGLPDDWTLVPYRGALAKDAPRYRALGNSFAVNCVRWIGRRIEAVEAILNGEK